MVAASLLYEVPSRELLGYGPFWKDPPQISILYPPYRQAISCYLRSLNSVQMQIQRGTIDINVALISCTLFICIETLLGHSIEAVELYKQGTRMLENIMNQSCYKRSQPEATLLEQIIAIYIRLGTVAYITAGVPFKLPVPTSDDLGTCTSLPTARNSLIRLVAETSFYESAVAQYIGKFGHDQLEEMFCSKMQELQRKLKEWFQNFEWLCSHHPITNTDLGFRSTLSMIYHAIYIVVAVSLRRQEATFDQYLEAFSNIVQHAERAIAASVHPDGVQPHFTFEIGVGIPLLLTALKCRDSLIRRKALALLKQCPPTQGFYMVSHGSALVEKAIDIEESLGCDLNYDDLVEEETKRLQYVIVDQHEPAAFGLICARKERVPGKHLDDLVVVQERVPLQI